MWIKTIAHSVSSNPMRRRPARRRRPASRMNLELLEDRRLLAITVNTLVDELDGSIADGDISLRDAITAASSGETINFATTGIIHLTLGQLPIYQDLTISGPGEHLLTIDASGNDPTPTMNNGDGSRVFNIDDGNGLADKSVVISGMSLTGGDVFGDGGGIRNGENLTLSASTISGNVAQGTFVVCGYYGCYYYHDHTGGGIWNSGSLTVTNVTIAGNSATGGGGGIHATGSLAVNHSAISGNASARDGGGIYWGTGSAMVLTSSTVQGNSASGNGGGIHGRNLTVTGSTISGNAAQLAGGGVSGGNLTITGSTIRGNSSQLGGGGINSSGDLAVSTTTIDGNTTGGSGGGIWSSGVLMAISTTISENMAGASGGGVHAVGASIVLDASTVVANSAGAQGGGVSSTSTHLMILNGTVTSNTAVGHGGGLFVDPLDASQATASIAHSTVVNNLADRGNTNTHFGGGLFVRDGAMVIDHSIVANNFDTAIFGAPSDLTGLFGATFDVRWSLIGHNADFGLAEAPVGSPDANGNLVGGAQGGAIDPLLGPLVKNGGPTPTYALLAGSPALDAGRPTAAPGVGSVPLRDQRGSPFTRVFDGDGSGVARIDMGATERQSVANLSPVVDTLLDESDGDYSAGDLSLREAVELARGSVLTADAISFAASLTSGGPVTITLTQGELVITDSLSIAGPGASLMTIDASGNDPTPQWNNGDGSRLFDIDDGDDGTLANVSLIGLLLTGGDVNPNSGGGGAIRNHENLAVIGCTISGNAAIYGNGGGIESSYDGYNNYDQVTVADSTISGNTAGWAGGGISAGNLTVTNSTIHGNSAYDGGGINGDNVEVTLSTIDNNSANDYGGGIYASNLALSNSTLSGNSASCGGGISGDFVMTVTESTISGNSASDCGGGIYNYYGDLTVTNSTISGNTASHVGGGLFNYGGLSEIQFSTITDNRAPAGAGSGIASYGDSYTRTRVGSSIIAGNANSDVSFVFGGFNSFQSNGYNLIGTGNAQGRFNQAGDQRGVTNPRLGPLVNNGGLTKTHALLPESPAIDRGNPGAVAGVGGVPEYDQRDMPFGRVADGDGDTTARIDIGAFEVRPATTMDGDFNHDGNYDCQDINALVAAIVSGTHATAYDLTGDALVNLADRDAWLAEAATFHGLGAPYKLGDADLNGVVDGGDFIAWNTHKFTAVAEWCSGDFTADGAVDGQDFIAWNNNKFTSSNLSLATPNIKVNSNAKESPSVSESRSIRQEIHLQPAHDNTQLLTRPLGWRTDSDDMTRRRIGQRLIETKEQQLMSRLHEAAFSSWTDRCN